MPVQSHIRRGSFWSITLVAKMIHCYAVKGEQTFVSGWAFMPGTSERTDKEIGQFLDLLI